MMTPPDLHALQQLDLRVFTMPGSTRIAALSCTSLPPNSRYSRLPLPALILSRIYLDCSSIYLSASNLFLPFVLPSCSFFLLLFRFYICASYSCPGFLISCFFLLYLRFLLSDTLCVLCASLHVDRQAVLALRHARKTDMIFNVHVAAKICCVQSVDHAAGQHLEL